MPLLLRAKMLTLPNVEDVEVTDDVPELVPANHDVRVELERDAALRPVGVPAAVAVIVGVFNANPKLVPFVPL